MGSTVAQSGQRKQSVNLMMDQQKLSSLNKKQKNRLEKVSRASGTHWTTIRGLISMSLEPPGEQDKGMGLKKIFEENND